jgi:prolyl 4-hydroxylase
MAKGFRLPFRRLFSSGNADKSAGKKAATSKPEFMPINEDYPGLRRVHDRPPIYVVDAFLSDEECDHFIRVAEPLLQRSKTHAVAGSEATKGRTSLTCHLSKKTAPCPQLLQKLHTLTNKPFGHMELPQVARYTDGQRYVEHYDGVDPHTDAGRAFCASGGQRVGTVLMYLNDVEDGGGTYFRSAAAPRPRDTARARSRRALPLDAGGSISRCARGKVARSSSSRAS